jgi:hypothetical protein
MKKTPTAKKTSAKAAVKPAKKISITQVPAQADGLGDSLTIRIKEGLKAALRLQALTEGHGKISRVAQRLLAEALK